MRLLVGGGAEAQRCCWCLGWLIVVRSVVTASVVRLGRSVGVVVRRGVSYGYWRAMGCHHRELRVAPWSLWVLLETMGLASSIAPWSSFYLKKT